MSRLLKQGEKEGRVQDQKERPGIYIQYYILHQDNVQRTADATQQGTDLLEIQTRFSRHRLKLIFFFNILSTALSVLSTPAIDSWKFDGHNIYFL